MNPSIIKHIESNAKGGVYYCSHKEYSILCKAFVGKNFNHCSLYYQADKPALCLQTANGRIEIIPNHYADPLSTKDMELLTGTNLVNRGNYEVRTYTSFQPMSSGLSHLSGVSEKIREQEEKQAMGRKINNLDDLGLIASKPQEQIEPPKTIEGTESDILGIINGLLSEKKDEN